MKKVRRFMKVVPFAACAVAPLALLPCAGQTAPKAPAKASAKAPAQNARTVGDFVLGADDVIEITVSNHDELHQVITIRPDGKIAMPRIARQVQAAGKTPQALAAFLQKELAKSINHGVVTVSVKEVHSQRARIVGAVKTPGTFELKPKWRLMDLIAAAGGLDTKVARVSGRLMRGGKNVMPLSIGSAFEDPAGSANILLRTGDLVMLEAQNIVKQVHVGGAVKSPGAFDLEEGLTPVSLLAEAGGAKEEAALSRAHVMRGSQIIPLDLRPTLDNGEPNLRAAAFKFQLGDILEIPENQLRFGVGGKVVKPGFFPYPENKTRATVLKTLALAGGESPEGDLRKAEITRTVDGKPTTIPVNIEAIMKGEAADDVILLADDVLNIPERRNQVTVSGKVGKPGAYEIKDGMTLISLVAEAGSPATNAGLSKAYVLRGKTQIPVDLYAALIQGRPSEAVLGFELQNNDVLVIPDTSNQINVIGQVMKAGVYNLDDNLTIASLLGQAGGATNDASLGKAYVQRGDKQIPVNLRPTVDGIMSPTTVGFRFEAGDALVIPTTQARFAVVGAVRDPGSFAYPESKADATVISVLNRAGGQSPDANLKGASIFHTSTNQSELIDISKLLKTGGAGNVVLRPGDVLYIPSRDPVKPNPLGSILGIAKLFTGIF